MATFLPSPFADLERVAGVLERFLRAQAFDYSPLILTQPPSKRESRSEDLHKFYQQVESQWSQFQQTYSRLTAVRDTLKQQYAMCCTAYSPISALPHEVLRGIFELANSLTPLEQRVANTRAISNVCRDWKEVVLTIPSLWSTHMITSLSQLPSVIPSIRKFPSQDISLFIDTICHNSDRVYDSRQTQVRTQQEDDLASLARNISYLEWKSSDNIFFLFQKMRNSTTYPQLEFYSLTCLDVHGDDNRCDTVLELSIAKFFKLDHLLLYHAIISSSNATLTQNLQTVDLKCVSFDVRMCDHLFRAAPKLEWISADSCSGGDVPILMPEMPGLPSLPVLNELAIWDGSEDVARLILGFLHCPSLSVLSLSFDDGAHEAPGSFWCNMPVGDHPAQMRISSLANCLYRAVRIDISDNEYRTI